ncbi:hypothetical protein V6S20_02195 [Klebsiella pneumoniae]
MIDPTYSQGKGKNDGYGVRCITTMSVDKAPAAAERPKREWKNVISVGFQVGGIG